MGKRLTDKPEATLTLVGCNAGTGKEKGAKKLSAQRAEAVRNYLQTVWNIAPERLQIEARNLPAMPSTSRLKEGQAENRRVEIRASDPLILAPIRSVYLGNRIDTSTLKVQPSELKPGEIAGWKVTAANTFIATALAVSTVGAKPVLVDMDPETFNLNPDLLEAAITPATRDLS